MTEVVSVILLEYPQDEIEDSVGRRQAVHSCRFFLHSPITSGQCLTTKRRISRDRSLIASCNLSSSGENGSHCTITS